MISLLAKIRKESGKKVKNLREKGIIPAILYGPKIKNFLLEVDLKEFEETYRQSGESSLIELKLEPLSDGEKERKFLVLINALEIDPISQAPLHIDFYQPNLDKEIVATVPLLFEGESEAVKSLSGTLVKNIHELEIRALPQNLPYEIKVDISGLKTFEDDILVKDLILPKEVEVLKDSGETVVFVAEPEKVEEELAKPVEEKVEEVEKAEEKEKREKGEEDEGEKEE